MLSEKNVSHDWETATERACTITNYGKNSLLKRFLLYQRRKLITYNSNPPPPPGLPFQTLIRLTQKTSILDKLRTQPLRQKRLHRRMKMKPVDQLQYPRGSDWPLELLGCSIFRWSPDTQVCIYQNPSPWPCLLFRRLYSVVKTCIFPHRKKSPPAGFPTRCRWRPSRLCFETVYPRQDWACTYWRFSAPSDGLRFGRLLVEPLGR